MSIDFDGINDYVNFGNNSLNIEWNTPFSISFWGKYSNIISKKSNNDPWPGWWCELGVMDTGEMNFELVLENTAYVTGKRLYSYADTNLKTLSTNTWIHFAVTYDGSGNYTGVKFYINSNLDTTKVLGDNYKDCTYTIQTTQDLCMGGKPGAVFTTGQLAEVKVYNNVLTQAQIKSDMYRSIVAESGLRGYWRLDEGKLNAGPGGKCVVDLSGNGNHGDDNGSMTDSDYVGAPPITMLKSIY
jgi:hypothetical protein